MSSPRLLNSSLRQHVIGHLVDRVRGAASLSDPFPHLVIDTFFPTAVYQEMLARIPAEDHHELFGYDRHQTNAGEPTRKRFPLNDISLDKLDEHSRAFWLAIRAALGSRELQRAVFDMLTHGLARRFGCDAAEIARMQAYALPELMRETTGYRIKPHPDTRRKIVTMQVSLAADESQKDLGTEFYRVSFNPAAWSRQPRGFEVVKRVPFSPNTAYAFVVLNTLTLRSWHGRSELPEGCGVRQSLLNIWYLKPEDANPEIVRDNEAIERESS